MPDLVICNNPLLYVNIDINRHLKPQIMLLKNNLSIFFGIFLVSMILVPNVSAQEVTIPDWIKNNAGWWAGGLIDDSSFVSGIQWLISNGIMIIPPTEQGADDGGNVIPDWIKNNAGWWAGGLIDDNSFVSGIQWLISNGIMIIPPTEQGADDGGNVIPDWIKNNAGWWAGGLIDDNSFVSGLQWLISNGIIMLESEVNNQDPDEEGRIAGGILTGENCNTEIDKDGDKVPDNLDVEGPINWSHCTIEGRDLSNRDLSGANLSGANLYGVKLDNTDLSGADLSYTVLYKASLANTVFTGANLSYANMCGATNPVVKGAGSAYGLEELTMNRSILFLILQILICHMQILIMLRCSM